MASSCSSFLRTTSRRIATLARCFNSGASSWRGRSWGLSRAYPWTTCAEMHSNTSGNAHDFGCRHNVYGFGRRFVFSFGQQWKRVGGNVGKSENLWVLQVVGIIVISLPAYFIWEEWNARRRVLLYRQAVGDKVFMDIGIGDRYAGRILIGLYSNIAPLTCENFLQLCKGYQIRDKVIGYQNTFFHTIKPGACVVGGDVLTGTGKSHGMSIYGECFPDENFDMEFLQDGDLAMVNWGKNSNASSFMITLSRQQHLYGHHVVFGTVLKGMRVVREMGELGTRTGRPVMQLRILQCGVVEDGKPPPGPPMDFMPKVGPMLSEEEFRAKMVDKPGTLQPS